MTATDYFIDLVLSVVLIVGVYQFYFWCQRHPMGNPREFRVTVLDASIPFRPGWVWIYSFSYYPLILYTNLMVRSPGHFTRLATSYLVLLALQMAFFVAVPVVTPAAWRQRALSKTLSERFLAFVHRFDARSNSFPSMHTSVATLTALHLYPTIGAWAALFPVAIGLSCLFTKQHYLVDLPAGAALGWVAFEAFKAV